MNTGILYGRMVLTVGISLYATRLVLNALGETDYGIFNLVAGIIALLSFLNTAMTTSTQRYLSFHQGSKNPELLKKFFLNSLFLHLIIGVLVVLLMEVLGLFLFDGFLNVPIERVEATRLIYHYMSATVFFSIIIVPFIAALNAHENMLWIAIVHIVEALLKFATALLLFNVSVDRLVLYAQLMGAISVAVFLLHLFYCLSKYEECSVRHFWKYDKKMITELSSFAGWNLFGTLCSLGRMQGLAVLLNLFFGAAINASYAIANQVTGQLNFFSIAMLQSLNPQIMKSEGEGNRANMLRLSMVASKYGFFLLAFVAIPCVFEMKTILALWLKNVPEYTVVFCQLSVIGALINQLTIGLQSAIQATGKIKAYQTVVGSTVLLTVPLAYFLLEIGSPPYSVLIGYCCLEFIACGLRLYFLNKIAGLSIRMYVMSVFAKELVPLILSIAICLAVQLCIADVSFRFIITGVLSIAVFATAIYFAGLQEEERITIKNIGTRSLKKLSNVL